MNTIEIFYNIIKIYKDTALSSRNVSLIISTDIEDTEPIGVTIIHKPGEVYSVESYSAIFELHARRYGINRYISIEPWETQAIGNDINFMMDYSDTNLLVTWEGNYINIIADHNHRSILSNI